MNGLLSRLLRVLGLNAVPLGGLAVAGWSTATALALYWLETLLALPFVIARIALHRRATRASGHYRAHFAQGAESAVKRGTLLGELSLYGVVFTLAHGVFLALFLLVILPRQDASLALDLRQLRDGALVVLGVLILAFLRDLVGLRERPFVWVKEEARALLGRAALTHIAIIGGAWLGAATDRPATFVLAFGSLKLLAEISSAWPHRATSGAEPPKLLVALMDRLPSDPKKGGTFRDFYREERAREQALLERDERPVGEEG